MKFIMKKELEVVGAIFIENNKLFAVKRGEAKNPAVAYKYEFAGGKIEKGESGKEAIVREIKEELSLNIEVLEEFHSVRYEYEPYFVTLHTYLCKMLSDFTLKEHIEYKWIPIDKLDPTEWAPADDIILEKISSLYM